MICQRFDAVGFAVASTNHPENLDPAILERPSRFDRKFHFDLPTTAARESFAKLWNIRLETELKLSTEEIERVVEITDQFSYAYIRELFVSSLMQWISERKEDRLLPVLVHQAASLRSQMESGVDAIPVRSSPAVESPMIPDEE